MSKAKVGVFLAVVCVVAASVSAQENQTGGNPHLEPGVEVMKEGGLNIIVPQGATSRRIGVGPQLVVEELESYTGRKLAELEKQLGQLKADQEALRQEVIQLKAAVGELQKAGSSAK